VVKLSILLGLCLLATVAQAKTETAVFAGGCFWCLEADFDKLDGVVETVSGFDGGKLANPTYDKVSAGGTGYAEAVKVVFDPSKISYAQLVDYFWRHIDPTVKDAQFCDHGHQYRSAIFYLSEQQKQIAEQSKQKLAAKFPTIYTEITASTQFYPAEEYHQNFSKKHSVKYKYYRWRCGRDARVEEIWGKS